MVPIYCIESWFGLRYPEYALYFDVLRDMYEALVLYSFFQFIVCYLGGEEQLAILLSRKVPQEHVFPFNFCLRSWIMGHDFVRMNKIGTLQYVIVKPLLAVITLILESCDKYHDGEFNMKLGYVYVTFFNNFSQIWALYCLVLLFLAVHSELDPINPISKFATVKAIVFFTWWQAVFISILGYFGVFSSSGDTPALLNNFIICVEMLGFAFAHAYAFPASEFHSPEQRTNVPLLRSLMSITNPLDLVHDVKSVMKNDRSRSYMDYQGTGVSELLEKNSRDESGQRPLLESNESDGI